MGIFTEYVSRDGTRPKLLYTVNEVSEATGYSPSSVRDQIHKGNLKATMATTTRQGYRMAPEWVDEWLGRFVDGR